jgi:hypothetical protein
MRRWDAPTHGETVSPACRPGENASQELSYPNTLIPHGMEGMGLHVLSIMEAQTNCVAAYLCNL